MMNKDSFSLCKGASFHFEEDGHIIGVWFSAFSGLEKVFVDGVLVSSQRNLSMKSDQEFTLGDNVYKSELSIKSFFKGPFVCTLYKNNKPYKRKKLVFQDENKKTPFFMRFWFYLALGLVYGVVSTVFKFPDWMFVVFILAIFAFAYSYSKLTQSGPQIIEESI